MGGVMKHADISVARKHLWDQDFAMAAVGRVEGLLTYDRMRADMSSGGCSGGSVLTCRGVLIKTTSRGGKMHHMAAV